jgi:threonine dehydrogenase-like Zn-dependent dehydrogenase
MLDSNGCNTTSAAGVALLSKATDLHGKTAVVLAGTGPVGQRAAVLLAISGANVRLTSRKQSRSVEACEEMQERFGVEMTPMQASDDKTIETAMDGAHVVFGAAKAGIQLLNAKQWQEHPTLELIADVGTSKILGFEGIDVMDKDTERHGKRVFGGIGIGALKLKLHRTCIAKLFESNDIALDAEAIYKVAQKMA